MSMDRRGFIGRLLASTAGLIIAPEALLWRPGVDSASLPLVYPGATLTLRQIVMEMHAAMMDRLDGLPLSHADGHRIGENGVTQQAHIDMLAPPREVDRYGLDVDRYIKPAADLLADHLRQKGARMCGEFPLPHLGNAYSASGGGLCVRGITNYDAWSDNILLWFDVLFG